MQSGLKGAGTFRSPVIEETETDRLRAPPSYISVATHTYYIYIYIYIKFGPTQQRPQPPLASYSPRAAFSLLGLGTEAVCVPTISGNILGKELGTFFCSRVVEEMETRQMVVVNLVERRVHRSGAAGHTTD